MKKDFSIYEGEQGDPYDLIIPHRRVETFFPRGAKTKVPDEPDPPEGFGSKARNFFFPRSRGAVAAGADPAVSKGLGTTSTEGQNLSGGPGTKQDAATLKSVEDSSLPGGKAKLQEDGSLKADDGSVIPAGTRGMNELTPTKYTPAHKGEQHTPDQKRALREKVIDRVTKGAMLLPALLPLSLLLAALTQGLVDCDALDDKDHKITSIESARYPEYPEGTPEWVIKYLTYNKNKIKVRYSPCTQLLSTDNIDVKDSNLFDGNYGVKIVEPCVLLLDIGQEYTSNAASSNAYFKLHTSCSDRAFYNLGEDLHAIADTASTGAQGLFSGLFGSIPWSTIFLIVMFILAIWLAFGAFKALKGS